LTFVSLITFTDITLDASYFLVFHNVSCDNPLAVSFSFLLWQLSLILTHADNTGLRCWRSSLMNRYQDY